MDKINTVIAFIIRMHTRISLSTKMILLTVFVGILTWAISDAIQTTKIRSLFQAQMVDRLNHQSVSSRLSVDRYIKAHHQSVKLFVAQYNFRDYIKNQSWSSEEEIDIKTYRRSPVWFPPSSVLRTFVQPRFAILLDPHRKAREIYQSRKGILPAPLLRPTTLMLEKSIGQYFITKIDGIPHVISSERCLDPQGKLLAILMLASPVDEWFLVAASGSLPPGNVVALVSLDEDPVILASSNNAQVSAGSTLSHLQKDYFIIGEEFFDYGSAEEVIKLVSFISTSEVRTLTASIISSERKERAIAATLLIVTFAFVIFQVTNRIQRLTKRISRFSKNVLGTNIRAQDFTKRADQLYILEQRFHRLTEEVMEAREIIKREADEHTKLIVSNAFDAIITANANGVIMTWNPQASIIFGWYADEIIGQKITGTFLPQFSHEYDKEIKHFLENGQSSIFYKSIDITARHKEGHELFVELSIAPAQSGDGTIFIFTLHDITERKNAEQQLRKLSQAVMQSPASIVITDLNGIIEYVNPKFTEVTGYTYDEAVGHNPSILKSGEHPPEYYKDLWNTIRSGKEWKGEFCNRNKKGNLYWEAASISPIKNEDGITTHFIAVKEDMSDRKQTEEVIHQQVRRLSALRSMDKAILASLDLRLTLDIFLSQLIRELDIDAVAVMSLNNTTQILECIANKGFRTSALQFTRLRLGESNAGRAALERRIVTIPNLREYLDGFVKSDHFTEEDFITYFAVPLIAKGEVKGVLELFKRSYLSPDPGWFEFLESIAAQGAIAIDNATMFNDLERSNMDLRLAYDVTIEGWARALDMRDRETEGHSRRVTEMSVRIAREFRISNDQLTHIRRGALLHDIGKMAVPDKILLKPGKLTEEEWKIMKLHPVYARDMLYPIEYLRPSLDIPYYHHEKWNGSGYPDGLEGENIPLAARIFAVVDVWDALSSDRPYRPAWSTEKVKEYIKSEVGSHFDAGVVEIFLSMDM